MIEAHSPLLALGALALLAIYILIVIVDAIWFDRKRRQKKRKPYDGGHGFY